MPLEPEGPSVQEVIEDALQTSIAAEKAEAVESEAWSQVDKLEEALEKAETPEEKEKITGELKEAWGNSIEASDKAATAVAAESAAHEKLVETYIKSDISSNKPAEAGF